MSSAHVLCSLVTIQSWTRVIKNNNDDVRTLNVEKEKRKYQKWQKAVKGDVLCVAHNPDCSGTLIMVKVFEKWAEWNNVEQRQELLWEHKVYEEQNTPLWSFEVFEDQILTFGLSNHILIKWHKTAFKYELSGPKLQVFLLTSPCLTGVSVLEMQNLPHWKW